MCGICGKIYFDRSRPVERPLIEAMTRVLRHRGPDDSGIYVQGPVGLGHQRLSIIDLSPAGHQPMANEDGSLQLVYNGEIYNFEELRKELAGKGHSFRSHTDTEVIIHLYEEEGRDCVRKLRGMFAFALWDSRKQELFLARDRVGKKPLVYAVTGNAFVFASEIKALLQDTALRGEVNPEALHHYLTYQYVPGPLTIFRGIQKLPPAHTLVLHEGAIALERYWELSYAAGRKLPRDTDYIAAFNEVFRDAVNVRLRSDVPLGAFLSGGIDSSAIVAVMSGLVTQPVKTFSIGFEEAEYNELPYARMVARQYNTEHTEFTVKPDALGILPNLVRQYDEPFADPSAIPTYYVAQLTRQHVTVALNGDGGDESFAGYERYVANRLAAWYAKTPRLLREGIIKNAVNLLPYREHRWSISRRLKRFINGIEEDPARRYVNWLCYFSNRMKEQLYSPGFMESVRGVDSLDITAAVYRHADTDNLLEQTQYTDVNLYLPYDLLVKADIACMAHSLEARSPFLDHRLMEFAAALPPGLKLRGLQKKYILKKAFAPLLPREILFRRKMGFGVPLDRWFRQELRQAACDVLLDPRAAARGYFRPEEVRRLLDEHTALRADHSFRIWALFWLELWHRMFVDKSRVLGI